MIVVDTNTLAYLLIQGDRTEQARAAWQRDPEWRAPSLWRSEFLNVLATSVRAGVLSTSEARDAWTNALAVMGSYEVEVSGEAVLDEALGTGLSAYDAQFVVAARNLSGQLVTSDRRILAACPERATSLADFARGN